MLEVPDKRYGTLINNNTASISNGTLATHWKYSDELWATALTLCCLSALYCNGIVLTSLLRQKKGLIALDILFANLAVSNCTLAVSTFPFVCVSAFYHGWIFGKNMCNAYAFVTLTLGLCSVYTLLGISVLFQQSVANAAYASVELIKKKHRKLAIIFAVGSYLTAALLSFGPLVGFGAYDVGKHGFSCTVVWKQPTVTSYLYLLTLFLFGFFVPLLLIGGLYVKVATDLRSIGKTANKPHPDTVGKWSAVCTSMLKMGISVTIVFLLSWTPYTITSILEIFETGDEWISATLEGSSALFAKSSTVWTPLVHLYFIKRYRRFLKHFCCIYPPHHRCRIECLSKKAGSSEVILRAPPNPNSHKL